MSWDALSCIQMWRMSCGSTNREGFNDEIKYSGTGTTLVMKLMTLVQRYRLLRQLLVTIDGTHIRIQSTSDDGNLYVHRKHFHSININREYVMPI